MALVELRRLTHLLYGTSQTLGFLQTECKTLHQQEHYNLPKAPTMVIFQQ